MTDYVLQLIMSVSIIKSYFMYIVKCLVQQRGQASNFLLKKRLFLFN